MTLLSSYFVRMRRRMRILSDVRVHINIAIFHFDQLVWGFARFARSPTSIVGELHQIRSKSGPIMASLLKETPRKYGFN